MNFSGDNYTLSTGRRFYANQGLLSVDATGKIHEGYDGEVMVWDEAADEAVDLTPAERREVAEFMIQRWTAFRDGTGEPANG